MRWSMDYELEIVDFPFIDAVYVMVEIDVHFTPGYAGQYAGPPEAWAPPEPNEVEIEAHIGNLPVDLERFIGQDGIERLIESIEDDAGDRYADEADYYAEQRYDVRHDR